MRLFERRSEWSRWSARTLLTMSRYQSRAFLLLPMCSNIGVIIGPLLGGVTSDPAANYPGLFGGIRWLERFPYAPPNLLSAVFLCSAALSVFFGLQEVGTILECLTCANLDRLMIPSEIEMILGFKLATKLPPSSVTSVARRQKATWRFLPATTIPRWR